MENASKALIIAGAILIAIMLISLGIIIVKSTSGTTQNAETVGQSMGTAADNAISKIAGVEDSPGEITQTEPERTIVCKIDGVTYNGIREGMTFGEWIDQYNIQGLTIKNNGYIYKGDKFLADHIDRGQGACVNYEVKTIDAINKDKVYIFTTIHWSTPIIPIKPKK